MKKFVSLLLAGTCLSVGAMLASCGQNGKVTTTVTEEEWRSMFVLSNETVNGSYIEGGQNETLTITVANNQCISTTVEPDETFSGYIFLKDDVWYFGEDGARGLTYWEMQGITCITFGYIFEPFGNCENDFDKFTYDADKKAYVRNNNNRISEVYVENGKIAKILYNEGETEEPTHTFIFGSYGTTAIGSFPEFCFNHTYETDWTYDEDAHWYACTTENCGMSQEGDWHEWNPDRTECIICGYKKN